jgi:ribokinase
MKKKYDVLGLGVVAVDDLIYLDHYPKPDEVLDISRRERQCGGLTATALVAASRLGTKCAYAGVLGEDTDSEFGIRCLTKEGIDLEHLIQREGARPIRSTILVDSSKGLRTILCDLHGVVGAGNDHPPETVIESTKVLFVDNFGLDGMIRAARIARSQRIPVVADFGVVKDPRFPELLEAIDHLILSLDYALELTGTATKEEALESLMSPNREVAVLTDGANGCWALEAGGAIRQFPSYPVEVMDTTGCGDVFHGAYAAGLARGRNLEDRIRLASATAALKATRLGGQAGIPDLATVEGFLNLRGVETQR